jgi:hypothetical protein
MLLFAIVVQAEAHDKRLTIFHFSATMSALTVCLKRHWSLDYGYPTNRGADVHTA